MTPARPAPRRLRIGRSLRHGRRFSLPDGGAAVYSRQLRQRWSLVFQSLPRRMEQWREYESCLLFLSAFTFSVLIGFFVFSTKHFVFSQPSLCAAERGAREPCLPGDPVRTADGIDLKAWYAPATSKPFTFVFFHGNGDCLLYRVADRRSLYLPRATGFCSGVSRIQRIAGKPTEAGLYADGRAYIYALKAQGVESENIILFGHSLGLASPADGRGVPLSADSCCWRHTYPLGTWHSMIIPSSPRNSWLWTASTISKKIEKHPCASVDCQRRRRPGDSSGPRKTAL